MSEPSYKHATLAAALVAAQHQAKSVSKTSKNQFHGYKYASAEALIAEAREALADHGLAVMPVEWSVVSVSDITGVGSKIVVTYMLVHEGGASVSARCETSILPEKGRPQDKAEATALTYNLGYYLRGLLLLPREDESTSVDARDDSKFVVEQRASRPPRDKSQDAATPPPAPAYDVAAALADIAGATSLATLGEIRDRAKQAKISDPAVRQAFSAKQAELGVAK